MPVFKLTDGTNAAIRGGADQAAGINKLKALSQHDSMRLLEGIKTNILGANGVPKHGVLKLRNSSDESKTMEFARMRGLDRMLSKRSAFDNTANALKILMQGSGLSEEKATELLNQYLLPDRSIKYKDALKLINETLASVRPKAVVHSGKTLAEALARAGIKLNDPRGGNDATAVFAKKTGGVNAGAFGEVFEGQDAQGAPCMLKRFKNNYQVQIENDGTLPRGQGFDSNHLAVAKLPGVIAPKQYLLKETYAKTSTYYVVNAGRDFKQFCDARAKHYGDHDFRLKIDGIVMNKAPGTRMREANPAPAELQGIARSFASTLMNAAAHGFVFGDIKPENAFIDGDQLTLIDTDGALKQSKWASKKTDQTTGMGRTFLCPGAGKFGMQQDLWSTGFTLLEAQFKADKTEMSGLFEMGSTRWAPRRTMNSNDDFVLVPQKINRTRFMDELQAIVGQPEAGSVNEFALLCIKTALGETRSAYTERFTGEGRHLIDPLLAHPLLGGREQFIKRHLVKSSPLSKEAFVSKDPPRLEGNQIAPLLSPDPGESSEKTNPAKAESDLDTEDLFEKPRADRRNSDSFSSSNGSDS